MRRTKPRLLPEARPVVSIFQIEQYQLTENAVSIAASRKSIMNGALLPRTSDVDGAQNDTLRLPADWQGRGPSGEIVAELFDGGAEERSVTALASGPKICCSACGGETDGTCC